MKQIVIVAIASFAAAFAAASWVYRSAQTAAAPDRQAVVSFDQAAPVEERIAALEQAVSDEQQARQLLQEEVLYLTEELARFETEPENTIVASVGDETATAGTAVDEAQQRRAEFRRRNSPEARVQRLIDAGFMPSEAERIVQREAELQMESLQAHYEAERSGDPQEWFRSRFQRDSALREELGDTNYERYLAANNRPTSVSVSNVIESSPAAAAGLLPGDEIVRYGGERVFSMSELTQRTMDGTPGESVAVDIMRDGVQMQIVMPRGPFGITGGRRR